MRIVKSKPELCNGCGKCMLECSKVLFKISDPQKSAIHIRENKQKSSGFDVFVCNHCGECISVCNTEAMYQAKSGAVRLDSEKCVECYICISFCPNNALFINKNINEPIKCIACGACTRVCPTGAIYMEEK